MRSLFLLVLLIGCSGSVEPRRPDAGIADTVEADAPATPYDAPTLADGRDATTATPDAPDASEPDVGAAMVDGGILDLDAGSDAGAPDAGRVCPSTCPGSCTLGPGAYYWHRGYCFEGACFVESAGIRCGDACDAIMGCPP